MRRVASSHDVASRLRVGPSSLCVRRIASSRRVVAPHRRAAVVVQPSHRVIASSRCRAASSHCRAASSRRVVVPSSRRVVAPSSRRRRCTVASSCRRRRGVVVAPSSRRRRVVAPRRRAVVAPRCRAVVAPRRRAVVVVIAPSSRCRAIVVAPRHHVIAPHRRAASSLPLSLRSRSASSHRRVVAPLSSRRVVTSSRRIVASSTVFGWLCAHARITPFLRHAFRRGCIDPFGRRGTHMMSSPATVRGSLAASRFRLTPKHIRLGQLLPGPRPEHFRCASRTNPDQSRVHDHLIGGVAAIVLFNLNWLVRGCFLAKK